MDKEPIDDFGVIVNDRDGQQPKEFNTDEAALPIRVPHDIFDKFIRAAAFKKYPSVEAWAASTLVQSLTTKIGAPSIDAPDQFCGQDTKKISGPSNSGMIRRS